MGDKTKVVLFMFVSFFVFSNLGLAVTKNDSAKKVPDAVVKTMIEHRLTRHDLLTNNNIQVNVANDTITLTGTVATLAEKKQAEKDAHNVEETYKVVNNLALKSTNETDQQLAAAVNNAIQKSYIYSVFDYYTATAKNGVVTLTGWVHQPWRKEDIADVAEKVPGVKEIKNEIQQSFGPGEIGIAAARVIYNDPLFAHDVYDRNPPIHIIVNNGQVILMGDVASQTQKDWAQTLVEFHTNAVSVANELKVEKK